MANRYAERTSVPTDKSLLELQRMLLARGAIGFMYAWEDRRISVGFKLSDRLVRIMLDMPDPESFRATKAGWSRDDEQVLKLADQAMRQRFRVLLMYTKMKFEAIDCGLEDFETAFLPHLVLPNRQTVGEWVRPQMLGLEMPKLLIEGNNG